MICYRDKAFCASKVKAHTCGRELTERDEKRAEEMGLPIAWELFCEELSANKKEDGKDH